MLIFSVKELPLLKKGKGVRLQRYKEESLLDVKLFPENVRNDVVIKKMFQKSIFRPKRFFWVKQIFGSRKKYVKRIFGSKKNCVKNIYGSKIFGLKKVLCQKKFCVKKSSSSKLVLGL